MRPGLVIVGAALLVLGGGAVLTTAVFPPGATSSEISTLQVPLTGGPPYHTLLWMVNSTSATYSISWSATLAVTVSIAAAHGCTSANGTNCVLSPPETSWTGALQGRWSISGSLSFPYLLEVSSPGSGSFSATSVESYSSGVATLPGVSFWLVIGSATALAIIGAVALFLGLFLRGGIYRQPASVVSRSAEDVADVVEYNSTPPMRPN